MHNSLVLEYLRDYAKHFNLLKVPAIETAIREAIFLQYIKYNTGVTKLTPAEDYEETGRWRVITDKGDDEIFDFVFVCTGHHAYPVKPQFEGLDKFQVTIKTNQKLHYADYAGRSLTHTIPARSKHAQRQASAHRRRWQQLYGRGSRPRTCQQKSDHIDAHRHVGVESCGEARLALRLLLLHAFLA